VSSISHTQDRYLDHLNIENIGVSKSI
jgi:hypothetical protein